MTVVRDPNQIKRAIEEIVSDDQTPAFVDMDTLTLDEVLTIDHAYHRTHGEDGTPFIVNSFGGVVKESRNLFLYPSEVESLDPGDDKTLVVLHPRTVSKMDRSLLETYYRDELNLSPETYQLLADQRLLRANNGLEVTKLSQWRQLPMDELWETARNGNWMEKVPDHIMDRKETVEVHATVAHSEQRLSIRH